MIKPIYLNNAGQARLSPAVKAVGISQISADITPHAEADQRRIRQLFAQLVDAQETDIAIHPSTAFAITMAAQNIYRQQVCSSECKGRVLVLQDQMNSAVYPWQDICHLSNGQITLDIVQYPDGDEFSSWTDAVLAKLGTDVIAACLPPLHWSDGAILDLVTIGKTCRELGVILIVDSTQATGIMKCSVKEIQPAMMACSVHKWIRAPTGASLVYVAPELHSKWSPLDQHARGRDLAGGANWDAAKDKMGPDGYPDTFLDDARKFDSGGKPNPMLLPMIRAALDEVVSINIVEAQLHLKSLMGPLIDWAKSRGYGLTRGPHAYHLVGIRPTHLTPAQMIAIAMQLQQDSIYIAVRCGAFRVSPYLDTTKDEIAQLIESLCDGIARV